MRREIGGLKEEGGRTILIKRISSSRAVIFGEQVEPSYLVNVQSVGRNRPGLAELLIDD